MYYVFKCTGILSKNSYINAVPAVGIQGFSGASAGIFAAILLNGGHVLRTRVQVSFYFISMFTVGILYLT